MSKLDQVYRSFILTKFFIKGWGNPEALRRLLEFRKVISIRKTSQHLVCPNYPVVIDKEHEENDCIIQEGHFLSPFVQHLPDIMPKEVETARFQVVLPKKWRSDLRPVCLHLAGTGDHYFKRRRTLMAKPLLKEAGIASIILENPYYGYRKPKQQTRSSLHNVSDLFVMGGGLVMESMALFHWCKRQGYGPLGITGISMGGHMASLAACNWPEPLSLIPCLSWTTATSVFMEGVMSGAIPWKLLQEQFEKEGVYGKELNKLVFSPELHKPNPFFHLGKEFVKNYPESLEEMQDIHDLQKFGDLSKLSAAEILELKQLLKMDRDQAKDIIDKYANEKMPNGYRNGDSRHNFNGANNKNFHTSTNYHAKENQHHSQATSAAFSPGFLGLRRLVELLRKIQWPRSKSGTPPHPQDSLTSRSRRKKSVPLQEDALEFMQGILDECTHLGNFSVPVDPELIILVLAERDAYVPTSSTLNLLDLWPGAEVRYINTGHIGAFLFKQDSFRKAIKDSFDRQIEKYYS